MENQRAKEERHVNHGKTDAIREFDLPVIDAQVRLGGETSTIACLLDIGSNLTIASPELMDFCVDLEDERVSFSGAGSHGTSEKSGTLSVKLGSAPWESVTAHFARLPAGIDMILGLDNGQNKVDVAQREARIGPTDFVFRIQSTPTAGALDPDSQKATATVPGLGEVLEKHNDVFALEKWSAASKLPPIEID